MHRLPQPRKEYVPARAVAETEITSAYFTWRQKGRFYSWLINVTAELEKEHRTLAELLPDNFSLAVQLYLFPQNGRWLTQPEVMAQLTGDPNDAQELESIVHHALTRVWRYIRTPPEIRGDRIELLRLPFSDYSRLLAIGVSSMSVLKAQSAEFFEKLCGAREQFEEFTGYIRAFDASWEPPVVTFRQELLPDKAFYR